MAFLEIQQLAKTYPASAGTSTVTSAAAKPVFEQVSFTIERGEFV